MESKEVYIVYQYEKSEAVNENYPCACLGVFSTYKKAEKAMLEDADDLIKSLKSDGYEYYYDTPDECNFPQLIVQENIEDEDDEDEWSGDVFYYAIRSEIIDVEPTEPCLQVDLD